MPVSSLPHDGAASVLSICPGSSLGQISPGMLRLQLPQQQNDATVSSRDAEAVLTLGTRVSDRHRGHAGASKGPGRIKPFLVMNIPSLVLETDLFEPSLGTFLLTERWLPLLEPPLPRDRSTVHQEPEPQIYWGTRWKKPGGLSACCHTSHSRCRPNHRLCSAPLDQTQTPPKLTGCFHWNKPRLIPSPAWLGVRCPAELHSPCCDCHAPHEGCGACPWCPCYWGHRAPAVYPHDGCCSCLGIFQPWGVQKVAWLARRSPIRSQYGLGEALVGCDTLPALPSKQQRLGPTHAPGHHGARPLLLPFPVHHPGCKQTLCPNCPLGPHPLGLQ